MAHIENNNGKQNGRRRSHAPRVDMTAMVDVAFLLLTFFILTTTMAKPKAMPVTTPVPDGISEVACFKVMTIFPGADGKFHHFTGCDAETIATSSLLEVRAQIFANMQSVDDLIISIQPTENSSFQTVVEILDEMNITGARKYALSEITEDYTEFLALKGMK